MDKILKKVTLDELIKNAVQKKKGEKKTKKLYVQSLDGYIVIEKPDRKLCLDTLDMEDSAEADEYLVYECVTEPSLKSTELHQAYGVVRPQDIVAEIFEPGEIANISREILKFAGYLDSVKPVEDVKNL